MSRYYDAGDVDLDEEVVLDSHGDRITEARAEEMGDEALRRARGRPSLSGAGQHSPQVSFRIPEQLAEEAVERAQREGKSLSRLGREALEQYLRAP